MPDIKEIKKKINDDNKKVLWFGVDPIELLVYGLSKTDTKKELEKKKLKNDKKLFRIEIKFCRDELPNSGPMYLRVKTFVYKDNKIKKERNVGQEGYVWFRADKLNKFLHYEDLKYLILLINKKSLRFGSGIVYFHNYI
jgi:hypothetical protein